jgi:transcriptional regulator with XRE-family HTH domain
LKRPENAFEFTSEIGQRLKELRLKAGLSQAELAGKMGKKGKTSRDLTSRLELARTPNPSLTLVADFLAACGAGFDDISDLMPPRPEKRRRRKELSYQEKLDQVHRRAAGLHLALMLEQQLFKLVNDEELLPSLEQRTAMATYGRELFQTMLSARNRMRAAEKKLMSSGVIKRADAEGFRGVVARLFEQMEKSGDLDRKLVIDASAVASGKVKLPQVKRAERRLGEDHERRFRWWFSTRNSVIERIKNESRDLHPGLGIQVLEALPYLNVVSDFCMIAEASAPGSEERKQRFEERVARANDKHGCRVIGEFAVKRYDELKAGIPKKPMGK